MGGIEAASEDGEAKLREADGFGSSGCYPAGAGPSWSSLSVGVLSFHGQHTFLLSCVLQSSINVRASLGISVLRGQSHFQLLDLFGLAGA